jgi:rSAM/selenodomain-associated transferase 2
MSRPPVSIIIPTYNAMPRLGDCLAALVQGLGGGLVREAIVVDGGSSDASAQLAADMGCKVIQTEEAQRGRGAQLQAGAEAATGDWLLFLHGDTVLSTGWSEVVGRHIGGGDARKAAYFKLAFEGGGASAERVAAIANWRASTMGLPYGDAGLLISRAHYTQVGGYQALALMEDVALVRKIGGAHLKALNCVAETSPAKFVRGGWWRVPMRNVMLVSAFMVGVSPATLARWYK